MIVDIASFPDHMEESHMTWEWDHIDEQLIALVLCLIGASSAMSFPVW